MGCVINHYSCIFLPFMLVLISDFSLLKSIRYCFLFTIVLDRMNCSSLAPPSIITLTKDSVNWLPYFQKPYTLELGGDNRRFYHQVYNEVAMGQNYIFLFDPQQHLCLFSQELVSIQRQCLIINLAGPFGKGQEIHS